jgi:hypothetical protein
MEKYSLKFFLYLEEVWPRFFIFKNFHPISSKFYKEEERKLKNNVGFKQE